MKLLARLRDANREEVFVVPEIYDSIVSSLLVSSVIDEMCIAAYYQAMAIRC